MKVFTPPSRIELNEDISVFLAGTIDMGNSKDWQQDIIDRYKNNRLNFYNPRRENWNNDWEQSFESPEFFQQVTWELDALRSCDIIILNLLPGSKSPISLLELGLFAGSRKLYVCCPKDFYRSGNVQIVCSKFAVPLFTDIEDLLKHITKIYPQSFKIEDGNSNG